VISESNVERRHFTGEAHADNSSMKLNEHGKSGEESYGQSTTSEQRGGDVGSLAMRTLSLRMHDEKTRQGSLARPPARRRTPAALLVAGSAPVSSCTLDLRQALAGWQAGTQTKGVEGPLSLSLRTKRRRRTQGRPADKPCREETSLSGMVPALAQVNVPD
jgi:hypothetical protein